MSTTDTKSRPTATRNDASASDTSNGIRLPLIGLALAAIVAAAVAAILLAPSDNPDVAQRVEAPGATAAVTVEGDALLPYDALMSDPMIGATAPNISASYLDGTAESINFSDGTPRVMLFVAHWCPHCQAEVASLTSHWAQVGLPEDVEIVTVSTSVDDRAPNFPPADWFASEGWPLPVLRDSDDGDLAGAFGLTSFPYLVAVTGDGEVIYRHSGQQNISEFDALITALSLQ